MFSSPPRKLPGGGSGGGVPAAPQSLRQSRRRLSVVSDNKHIEGLSALGMKETDTARASHEAHPNSYLRFCGVSKKGYAAYNPRKRNQDCILMERHLATGSLLLGVFDGHGEAGDLVSRYFVERLPLALYKNAKFVADPLAALVEEIDRIEQLLLAGEWPWFSSSCSFLFSSLPLLCARMLTCTLPRAACPHRRVH